MKYIFLAGSIIFGIAGISQAMDAFRVEGFKEFGSSPVVFDFQYLTVSLTTAPGFVRILILSLGFFILYLIWHKLKGLGIGKVSEYSC
ncbi:MAG: hypothetical protein L3J69_03260 [Desulfobacula sp.]|nr:hypothetical protein [Desulfobacula sp.]